MVESCVAVCPNCHRALHLAKDKRVLAIDLKKFVGWVKFNNTSDCSTTDMQENTYTCTRR